MKHETVDLVQRLGFCMLEGKTYDETADEFNMKRETVKRLINEKLKFVNAELFFKIKNKPYMVYQRAIHMHSSIEEARRILHVSKENFDAFMDSIYEKNPRMYLHMRNSLYVSNVRYMAK